jgi:hypothetical protein
MQYMILIYSDEKRYAGVSEADMQKEMDLWMAYTQELVAAKVMLGGASLHPVATATTLRTSGGKVSTTDGPFAETKEQLGGYYLLDVADLNEALKWAGKCPGVRGGSIEVRPLGIISSPDGSVKFQQ